MQENKTTIKKTISFQGIGLHHGKVCTITFKPAKENEGVVFVRTDIVGRPRIPADIVHVIDSSRGTTIGIGKATVATIEHLLAAVKGLSIDNLIVEVDGPEVPVADGSAKPFVDLLKKAGIVEQNSHREYFELTEPISFSAADENVDIVIVPSDKLSITFMVDYKHPCLGTQYTWLPSISNFEKDFASARTFCFLNEIVKMREMGLIKGGSLDSAVVVADPDSDEQELRRLEKLFGFKKSISLDKDGLLNGTKLRYHNEFVRHKVLDLIGDMALLGIPIKGHILAARSGHKTNVELVRKLRGIYKQQKLTKKYQTKKIEDIVFDINAIQKILPHRYPFLLVDKIIEFEQGKKIVGIKNVTINEPFFKGHFPNHPIMPGVLIIEAMAQVGGIMLLNDSDNPKEKLAYFAAIDNVRFKKPVLPGDTLRMELKAIYFRHSLGKIHGEAFVGNEKVCEADLVARIVNR